MREITIRVSGYPPAKNEAKSMLAAGHVHAERVLALLRVASDEARLGDTALYFPDESLGLELIVTSPAPPPSDATNYLGGVADVLEDKGHRGALPHLGELAGFALYGNDRQFHDVHTGGSMVRTSDTRSASGSGNQIATVVIMSNNLPRLPMHAGKPAQLRDLGYDEIWLQNWLAADPARLGLGEVQIVAQELSAPRGGSLDILARDGDTYYSVEVQLGEVDASHSFRVFDYWARNRMRFKDKTHVAVLMVESATGRYRSALDALAEYLPLVVIELRAWRGEAEVILVPETVVINENLDVAGPAGTVAGAERSEADWQATISGEAWAFYKAFVAWTEANLGEVRVDYSPKSYIGIRRGRRVWAPLWPRKDGAFVYLPDPDGLHGEQQSPAMDVFQERLREDGLETNWQPTYNAGANPVSIRLRQTDLGKPSVQDLLRATFEILGPGATPWSELHADLLTDKDLPVAAASPAHEPG